MADRAALVTGASGIGLAIAHSGLTKPPDR